MLALSASVFAWPMGGVCGEIHTTAGVDITSCAGAPGDEVIRINVDPMHGPARAQEFALAFFSLMLPAVECDREKLCILHDFEDAAIIVASIPGYADADEPGIVEGRDIHDNCFRGEASSTTLTEAGGAASVPGGGPSA